MMTLSKVMAGAAASAYYSGADDYYAEGGAAPSAWAGRGAKALGLDGPVDGDVFARLLDGRLSDDAQMHRGGSAERVAAFDLTFSAPKSASMQALIHGDEAIVAAHEKAVAVALAQVESDVASYRETANSKTQTVRSGNVVAATFRHAVSRDLDPQLHTHCVVLNMTRRADGEWRALDAAALMERQKLLGAIYRNALATELRALRFGIRQTHDDGRFELAHVPQAAVEEFSTRRRSIDAALAARGLDRESASAAERQLAGLSTRKAKEHVVSRQTLRKQWEGRASKFNIQWGARLATETTKADRAAVVSQGVAFAIEHLTERSSVAMTSRLEAIAVGQLLGAGTLAHVRAEVIRLVNEGAVVLSDDGRRFTTSEAIALENDILRAERDGRHALTNGIQPTDFQPRQHDSVSLTTGQIAAATCVLTTTNRIVGVQGRAGTGKTTMLGLIQHNLSPAFRVIGLAPSAAAAREMTKAGIEAKTIAGFLSRGAAGLSEKSLVIIDEASMVSARDLQAVLGAVEAAGARAVLVGDTQQLASVGAGAPFRQLQEAGMTLQTMAEVLRQSDSTLRGAVEKAAVGETVEAVEMLNHAVRQVADDQSRYRAIAQAYASEVASGRDTLAVAATNHARRNINQSIRNVLGLTGKGVNAMVLEHRDLTKAQIGSSLSYQAGDVVEFLRPYRSIGARQGDTATVVSTEPGRIQLQMRDGAVQEWRPTAMPNVAVHAIATREIAEGDALRFTANVHALGVVNGERGRVKSIEQSQQAMTVTMTDGREVSIDLRRPLHVEHGYCTTVHASQGQTCDSVLIDAEASRVTASASLFYVAISRARSHVAIYTDDHDSLPDAMSRNQAKSTALQLDRPKPKQAEFAL